MYRSIETCFNPQAIMMDALISGFVEENKQDEDTDDSLNANNRLQDNAMITNFGSFTNKLSKFTLATFDEEGNNERNEFFFFFLDQLTKL